MNTIKSKLIVATITCMISLCFSNSKMDYTFRPSIDKDSLFLASISQMSITEQRDFTKIYKEADEESRDFMLLMISMPRSNMQELIQNLKTRRSEIGFLIQEYSKLVPNAFIVEIEYEIESKILTIPDQFDIRIYPKDETALQDGKPVRNRMKIENDSIFRNLEFGSKELSTVLLKLNWTESTLKQIISLLQKANCMSIENGPISTVGYIRSGMGKYSYKIFDKQQMNAIDRDYNDKCTYIKYDDNVVLEFQGGAIGQQCFESINKALRFKLEVQR